MNKCKYKSVILLVFSLMLLSCMSTSGYKKNRNVFLKANMNIGDEKVYKIRSTKEIFEKNELENYAKYEVEGKVTIKVIDSSDSVYKLKWVMNNNSVASIDDIFNFDLFEITFLDGLEIEYLLSNDGKIIEIVNINDIKDRIFQLTEYYKEQVELYKDISNEKKNELLLILNDIQKNNSEKIIIKNIKICHFYIGREYKTNKIYRYRQDVPYYKINTLIPADIIVSHENDYYNSNIIKIHQSILYDPNILKDYLKLTMKESIEGQDYNNINWEDCKSKNSITLNIDTVSGWPISIASSISNDFNGIRKVEFIGFTEVNN